MAKKKWLLLILCLLLIAGYWKFFYKTYSETSVAGTADCIFALDIKRVTNTAIWNIITTPGEWKKISCSPGNKPGWKDMIKIPDYVFVFHSVDQPSNAWYTVLEIKDDNDFEKGLLLYHFKKRESLPGQPEYFSKELGVDIIRLGDKILLGNNAVEDKSFIRQIAAEMFVQKKFIARNLLLKNIEARSHLSILVAKNNLLQEDAVIKLNFDKKMIAIDASLHPKKIFDFTENNFVYPQEAICSMGFTQPSSSVCNLITDTARIRISKALNFNIDSVLLQSNHYYNLNITAITGRADSAISYSYDDNFNQVENVVMNTVMEPSFDLGIHGDSISNIYHYWNTHGQLERTTTGDLFVAMPFVKSYCTQKNTNELSVASAGFQQPQQAGSINCIFFLKILLSKIPVEILKYLPAELVRSTANIESIEIIFKKNNEQVELHGRINKRENDLPVIKW